ncbi:Alpha/beta hydrolase-3 [Corchorus capsularis]|uniref:Alpha/beta hydrolase-3 n=1 Tax=Corchorus capsularis TaxID=210143 RepID=A0A1R3H669_COCAP|nr:Alpha/beta hydrolase-3 [Corchorus capsularis]
MSTDTSLTIDPFKNLQITLNPDGTLTRHNNYARTPAKPEDSSDSSTSVLSRDILINNSNKTWVRIYLPKQALKSSEKLPVILAFHGGGFILFSPDESMSHQFCSNMATELSVIIVSASYRLAPEHRLPAAYDDAMEALLWIKNTHDNDWLENYADLSKVFIMGGSAGGNIAYHLGLRAADQQVDDLLPSKIRGLILHQPFFGGVERTESELRSMNNPGFPPCVSDLMWELSLPIGVDRDHEYCNPIGHGSTSLEKIRRLGWKVFVGGCHGDQLIDRQIELVKMMEKEEIQVVSRFLEGGFHGLEIFDPPKAKAMFVALKDFIFPSM